MTYILDGVITGYITSLGSVSGEVTPTHVLGGGISTDIYPDTYAGDYTVIPAVYAQSLQTADKYLRDDINITEIPVIRADNEYGTTISIAS